MNFSRRGLLQSLLALPFVKLPKFDARDITVNRDLTQVRTNLRTTKPIDIADTMHTDVCVEETLNTGASASFTTKTGALPLGRRVTFVMFDDVFFVGTVVRIERDLLRQTDHVDLVDDIRLELSKQRLI